MNSPSFNCKEQSDSPSSLERSTEDDTSQSEINSPSSFITNSSSLERSTEDDNSLSEMNSPNFITNCGGNISEDEEEAIGTDDNKTDEDIIFIESSDEEEEERRAVFESDMANLKNGNPGPESKQSPIESNSSKKSMEIIDPKNDIIEDEESSEQILLSNPSTSIAKAATSSSIGPPMQPEFFSAEYLNRLDQLINQLRKLDELRMEFATAKNILKTNKNFPDNGKLMKAHVENLKAQLFAQLTYVSNLVVDGKDENNSLHDGSLETCPNDSVLTKNPRPLKNELMDNQKHALAWMQWREKQTPRGGILADDMGLDDKFKLPDISIELVEVRLNKDEMNVYQRVMTFSQNIFAQFLRQSASNNQEFNQFQIEVLLLRLQQICSHCGLIDPMLEEEDLSAGSDSNSHKEFDLLGQFEKLKIDGDEHTSGLGESSENSGENSIAAARVLSKNNIFDKNNPSSKFKKILNVLEEKLQDNEKAIIVSQWTSSLELLHTHLMEKGYRTVSLNEKVSVKDRNEIVTEFNKEKNKTKIMLLSLTACGVGFNLAGANHLFLIDLHWNPQSESLVQDRIYRVGQKKQVYIYKFMVKDTVEERIKHLQDNKLEVENGVLTETKSKESKLTLDDLKYLFGLS